MPSKHSGHAFLSLSATIALLALGIVSPIVELAGAKPGVEVSAEPGDQTITPNSLVTAERQRKTARNDDSLLVWCFEHFSYEIIALQLKGSHVGDLLLTCKTLAGVTSGETIASPAAASVSQHAMQIPRKKEYLETLAEVMRECKSSRTTYFLNQILTIPSAKYNEKCHRAIKALASNKHWAPKGVLLNCPDYLDDPQLQVIELRLVENYRVYQQIFASSWRSKYDFIIDKAAPRIAKAQHLISFELIGEWLVPHPEYYQQTEDGDHVRLVRDSALHSLMTAISTASCVHQKEDSRSSQALSLHLGLARQCLEEVRFVGPNFLDKDLSIIAQLLFPVQVTESSRGLRSFGVYLPGAGAPVSIMASLSHTATFANALGSSGSLRYLDLSGLLFSPEINCEAMEVLSAGLGKSYSLTHLRLGLGLCGGVGLNLLRISNFFRNLGGLPLQRLDLTICATNCDIWVENLAHWLSGGGAPALRTLKLESMDRLSGESLRRLLNAVLDRESNGQQGIVSFRLVSTGHHASQIEALAEYLPKSKLKTLYFGMEPTLQMSDEVPAWGQFLSALRKSQVASLSLVGWVGSKIWFNEESLQLWRSVLGADGPTVDSGSTLKMLKFDASMAGRLGMPQPSGSTITMQGDGVASVLQSLEIVAQSTTLETLVFVNFDNMELLEKFAKVLVKTLQDPQHSLALSRLEHLAIDCGMVGFPGSSIYVDVFALYSPSHASMLAESMISSLIDAIIALKARTNNAWHSLWINVETCIGSGRIDLIEQLKETARSHNINLVAPANIPLLLDSDFTYPKL